MFSRKDRSAVLANDANNNTQPDGPRHSAVDTYGLRELHGPAEAIADIILLHGLTGNRESTWTDKNSGVFWPSHLLNKDIPNSRILTWGYDADIAHFWAAASQNCIRNHAINLNNALAQFRERTETEERPIVFVTHSLGGLVFEDAMLASRNSPETHLQKVYNSTVGVCFLGTPHCGSTLANWATIFSQIAGTVKGMNTDLLRVLEPKSEVLARIQGDFHAMLRSQSRRPLAITCFFEELPVKCVGEIVPKHSAILPAYNSIGIHSNHVDMGKFSGKDDPRYLSVASELMRWVRAIQKARVEAVNEPVPPPQPQFPSQSTVAPPNHTNTTAANNNHIQPYPTPQYQDPYQFPPASLGLGQMYHYPYQSPSSDNQMIHTMHMHPGWHSATPHTPPVWHQQQQQQQQQQQGFPPTPSELTSTSPSPAPAPQIFRGGNIISGNFHNNGTFVQGGTVVHGRTINNHNNYNAKNMVQGGVVGERVTFE